MEDAIEVKDIDFKLSIDTIKQLANLSVDELCKNKRIDRNIAQKLIDFAKDHIKKKNPPKASKSELVETKKIVSKPSSNVSKGKDVDAILNDLRKKSTQVIKNTQMVRERDEFHEEKLKSDQIIKLEENIAKELKKLGFFIISKNRSFIARNYKNINMIAIKVIEINPRLSTIMILPIKVSNLTGVLILSDEKIEYMASLKDRKLSKTIKNLLVESNVNDIKRVQYLIFNDLTEEESGFFEFIKNHLEMRDLTIEKTISNKKLFLIKGQVQYKVLIDPILISREENGSKEIIIPFPYKKDANLHVVSYKKLNSLIKFLEKKYLLIEDYSKKSNPVDIYFKSKEECMANLQKISIVPLIVGFLSLIFLILQLTSVFTVLFGISCATLAIYFVFGFYFYFKFFKEKSSISNNFMTPYFKRKLQFSNEDLFIINEALAKISLDWMNQFVYEVIGKGEAVNLDVAGMLSENRKLPKNKTIEINIEKEDIANKKDKPKKEIQKESHHSRYMDFLEE